MKKSLSKSQLLTIAYRPVAFLSVVVLLVAASTGLTRAAGGQVQSRSIMMSDSAPSGTSITSGVGSGTSVTYRVTFSVASSYTLKGIILDFCSGSAGTPFIGDSNCNAPTAFTVGTTPTIDGANYTVGSTTTTGIGSTGWTAASLNSGQTLKLTSSTGIAVTSGTAYTFALSGVTNTSTLGTFYARLVTYTSDTGAIASYTHSTPGSYQDYGGFALSTVNSVQVTAKVQEAITFCVLGTTTPPTQTAPTSCADATATAPAILLGHGTNNTLDTTAIDTNNVYTFISTNALHGVNVRMHNSNGAGGTCGGLSVDGGTSCGIPATNGGAATTPTSSTQAIAAGQAAFGLSVSSNASDAIAAPYNGDPASAYYGMDATTTGSNVMTTYGSTVITSAGPLNNVGNTWTFAATASNTTPAGIYKANMAVIATGTF